MDLYLYHCGAQDCNGGHSFGPAVRDHYLIHYVRKGKGVFRAGERVYHLREGQGFLIYPDGVTFYQADQTDPWCYSWVGFNGLKAEPYLKRANLSPENPVFSCESGAAYVEVCLAEMIDSKKLVKAQEVRLIGLLYLFLSQLIESAGGGNDIDDNSTMGEFYVKKSIEYIHTNYTRKITINELSSYVGLNRSYLCTLFKEVANVSPQEFLINYRLDKACDLLKNNALSIGDVARSVGYDDPLLFSRIFSKMKDKSPREFRRSLRSELS